MFNFLLTILLSIQANAFVKVAVLDTGINPSAPVKLCPTGHYDFNEMREFIAHDPKDDHGTLMAKIIDDNSDKDYCIISYRIMPSKYYIAAQVSALNMAMMNGVQVINLSYSQKSFSPELFETLKKIASYNIFINIAAGNSGYDLDKKCDVFPACYDVKSPFFRVYGSLTILGRPDHSYNYGKVVDFYLPTCYLDGVTPRCGTSISAAIATGITVQVINDNKKQ